MKSPSGMHSKTQTKMNHFRVLLSVFLLSLLFHMVKGWARCSGTLPLPQCSLVSISNRCCKLELHLAGWMRGHAAMLSVLLVMLLVAQVGVVSAADIGQEEVAPFQEQEVLRKGAGI